MAERFNATQLRTVRVVITQKNMLWLHEEDVPWLVEHMVSELETGVVGQIITPHRVSEDENSHLSSQACAAVAGHGKGIIIKPITPITYFYKLRWGDEGAWEADILQVPRKETNIKCSVNNFTAEKWARASRVHNYTVDFANATFAGKKKAAMHFMKQYLQDLHKEMLAL